MMRRFGIWLLDALIILVDGFRERWSIRIGVSAAFLALYAAAFAFSVLQI
jgi:Ca2+/Na+ antiporter